MTTTIRLAPADVALLRRVITWRRTAGVMWQSWAGTYYAPDSLTRVTADDDTGRWAVGIAQRDGLRQPWPLYTWHEPTTVTEAVDLLVALGILPAHLSSAYTAGVRALADQVYDQVLKPACDRYYRTVKASRTADVELKAWNVGYYCATSITIDHLADALDVAPPDWGAMYDMAQEAGVCGCGAPAGPTGVCGRCHAEIADEVTVGRRMEAP